jgi:hypothetical protein
MPHPNHQKLAQAAKSYMVGEIPLKEYQALVRRLSPNYAHAALQMVTPAWLGRLARLFHPDANPSPL